MEKFQIEVIRFEFGVALEPAYYENPAVARCRHLSTGFMITIALDMPNSCMYIELSGPNLKLEATKTELTMLKWNSFRDITTDTINSMGYSSSPISNGEKRLSTITANGGSLSSRFALLNALGVSKHFTVLIQLALEGSVEARVELQDIAGTSVSVYVDTEELSTEQRTEPTLAGARKSGEPDGNVWYEYSRTIDEPNDMFTRMLS